MAQPVKERDFTVIARRTVEQAIGEHLDGSPLDERYSRVYKLFEALAYWQALENKEFDL